ncbi:hypothetical protein [Ralstonia solanacearum]|uniref:hypothetical protein n=1 Tax=Ralstonia solanacearum TaxID=305 RepID=UPI000E66B09F|nr:hypothetical protein HF906_12365 [Ralstonia solanacearum]RIJ87732.1 hypothetical protein RSP822_03685 [Ralstonia solanacearum]
MPSPQKSSASLPPETQSGEGDSLLAEFTRKLTESRRLYVVDPATGSVSEEPIVIDGPGSFECREGARIMVENGSRQSTETLVGIVLSSSMALGGKPVRCSGVVPGVTMSVSTGLFKLHDGEEWDGAVDGMWKAIRSKLVDWLTTRSPSPGLTIGLNSGVEFEFGWDGPYRIDEGAMQIDVRHDPAFAATYYRRRRQRPLVERAATREEVSQAHAATISRLLIDALEKCRRTWEPLFARLPVPIRYRVTGALAAWQTLWQQMDVPSRESLMTALRTQPIPKLVRQFADSVVGALPQVQSDWPPGELRLVASQSAVWQAFEVRNGVFYEPTPALHRLLDASFVADDVPVGMLKLPAETLCIIPEPSSWNRPNGIEAIVLFRGEQSISLATWSHPADGSEEAVADLLNLSSSAPDKTIQALLDDVFRVSTSGDENLRQHWRGALDYAIKMLLYLTVREAHVVHDRAYTDAPRNFSGLGKRKRAERLAEIEQLYDRHIVGPAILDAGPTHGLSADDGHREVRGHWRRPHFKMQPHGPNASLRKLVFIGPTIVRPDRLGL